MWSFQFQESENLIKEYQAQDLDCQMILLE
jgi:hypothetical protein